MKVFSRPVLMQNMLIYVYDSGMCAQILLHSKLHASSDACNGGTETRLERIEKVEWVNIC